MFTHLVRSLLALCVAVASSGCATYRHSSQVESGPGLEFDARDVRAFEKNQTDVLAELVKLGNVSNPPAAGQWDRVIDAGMDYADGKCEAYMHALFRLNRDKKTVTAQLGLLGTATAGLMAAAESAAKDVAATAVLFGLASSTVDNLASNLLYDLDPSSVRTLVKSLQSAFREKLQPGYDNRPAAMRVIRAYAMLCVPANIEAEVNLAIKKAEPKSNEGDPGKGQPPEVSNADSAVSTFKAMPDANTALLTEFVFPGGSLNAANRVQLEQIIRAQGHNVDVSSYARKGIYARDRAAAVKQLKLK